MSDSEGWRIVVSRKAEKSLRRLPRDLLDRIAKAIDSLAVEPRPPGCKQLVGGAFYRLRIGDWRIIYAIKDDRLIVLIVNVAPRGSAFQES